MVEGSVARRYAKALIEIAKEASLVDRFGDDLRRFAHVLEGPELSGLMASPVFTNSERRAVLDQLLPSAALHPSVVNFLRLLLDKDRFGAIQGIVREYGALADIEAGRIRAIVTTSVALAPALQASVQQAIAQSTGKQVVLETRIDPTLLGGIVAQVGGRVYDASLRTRLERLQLSLATPSQA